MPWNILFLKTVQMLALSLLQECYCPATFCRWCLIPGYKHGWSVPGLRKSSSGKAHCCCPPLGALWQTHAWPGHQLLPSSMDVSIPPALLTSVLRPRASLYYFDSIPQASLYLFILMPEICFSCSNSPSLSGICTLTYLRVQIPFSTLLVSSQDKLSFFCITPAAFFVFSPIWNSFMDCTYQEPHSLQRKRHPWLAQWH